MSLAHHQHTRRRGFARELVAYGVVGITNTAIDFAVFNAVISLGAVQANTISTLVSTTTSFTMNRHFVYRDRPRKTPHREYGLFFAVNLVGLVIQAAVMAVSGLGLPHMSHHRLELNLVKCLGLLVSMVFRFWAYRTIVFRPHPELAARRQPLATAPLAAAPAPAESPIATPTRTSPARVTPIRATADPGRSPRIDNGSVRGGVARS